MASGQLITIKLMRGDSTSPWGFRLQGGKDFAVPLTVVRVNPSSLADHSGLLIGDVVVKINGRNAELMKHKEAQDVIFNTGNILEITVQRGGMTTWKPDVTPVGEIKPTARLIGEPHQVTKTSLSANKQEFRPVGSSHNITVKPFPANPNLQLVHKQYNSPLNLYSESKIAETIEAHTEILSSGVKGINFLKPDAPVNTHSPVYQMVHDEEETRLKVDEESMPRRTSPITGTNVPVPIKHVEAPLTKPFAERKEKSSQNTCSECGRAIVGPFAKARDKSLHPECFRCSTCGTSLKNVGHFIVNDKLYCDIHAKQVASIMGQISDDYRSTSPIFVAPPKSNIIGPSITIPHSSSPPQSSGLSSPSVVGPIPFHIPGYGTYQPTVSSQAGSDPSNTSPSSTYRPPPSSQVNHESVVKHETKTITSYYQPPTPYQSRPIQSGYTSYSQTITQSKVPPQTAPKPQINPPWVSNISSALSGQSLMSGSRPAPRRGRGLLKPQVYAGSIPICSSCGSPIRGPFIAALGKTWCPDHFTCSYQHCRRSLQDIGFVEEQGLLYCEYCYEAYLAPICAKCNVRIKGDCLNALDKQWHPSCFICTYCKRPFGNSSFYLEDGLPYCEKDWNELFTTKCIGCGYAIEAGDRWVEALNQNYHSQCFKCSVCNKNLEGQTFYARGGRPYCKSHAR